MQKKSPQNKKRISIGQKVYGFIAIAVFMASFGASMIAYMLHAGQIDRYYKNLSLNTAINFASFVDGDFLKDLSEAVMTDEYITLRDTAEEEDNEDLIRDYLDSHGLWDQYDSTRSFLIQYLRNMDDIEYLYIMNLGAADVSGDVYLIDDDENPLYVTGSIEEDNLGIGSPTGIVEPSISNSEWGWLCSAYAPVFDSDGQLVCHIGCDVSMDDIMKSRIRALLYDILGSLAFTLLVTILAIHYTKRTVIKPLDEITENMGKFSPSSNTDYEKAGVIDLNIRNNDEIGDIYSAIQSMQKRIVDYINDIVAIQKEKEIAENNAKQKDKEIGELSKDAYRDSLTHVGNKIAYTKKTEEMDQNIKNGTVGAFAIVMIDVNFLKTINDNHGHIAGDCYLSGCCRVVCNIYKHSPVFRIGGDEFVVILINEDYEKRHERINEMRESFEQSYNQTDVDEWLRYSVAFGMSEYTPDDKTVESVYERADKEMYREKALFKQSLGLDPEAR
ncbi:MAG: sensor domain-containing diguanylate cyclase [Lachnospiraceae bacterium]|nr:sensor domain-containing diguanylate cyclase [Lachnospiraceae bacterium]